MAGDQGIAADEHTVDHEGAVPAGVAGRGYRHRRSRQPGGDVFGEGLRGRDAVAHHPALSGDRHRPLQPPRLPDVADDVRRRRLLEILPLGVPDFVGMAIHRCAMGFREPDGRAEVVDVGVGQQDRPHVVDAEPQLPQRVQHIIAAAGKPGVDQHDAVLVGHQRPVDQVGLREVDAVGDGGEKRRHPASVERRSRNELVAELKLGYKASAEQFAPRELVELAVAAEEHGMDSATVSDHFQPWRHEGGHAPFSLAWMAAVGERTKRLDPGHVGADADVPLQPGGHRAGVRDHGLPLPGPHLPRGRHR